MINICKTCGQEFAFPNPRQYCSHHCQVLSLKESNHNNKKEVICTTCNNSFFVPRNSSKQICNSCRKIIRENSYRVLSPQKCKVCGKEFSYDWRKDFSVRKNRPLDFCSLECAHSREHTLESREKVSKSLREHNASDPDFSKKKRDQVAKGYKTKFGKDNIEKPQKFCKICGKEISRNTKTGFCKSCLNHSIEGKAILSANTKRLMMEGKIKPWMSQAELSFPEKFWIGVLNNNLIPFESQVKEYPYRLDFLIEKNGTKLDLEIDGGQHQFIENKIHDEERDALLKSRGFKVYRIPWNEINSEKGLQLMKDKIDSFLEMYYSL